MKRFYFKSLDDTFIISLGNYTTTTYKQNTYNREIPSKSITSLLSAIYRLIKLN